MKNRLFLGVLLALLPSAVLATVVKAQTFEEMTKVAPLVVRATVQSSQAAYDHGERHIWTYTELQVTDTLKGEVRSALMVKQPGGEVGRIGAHVDGTAKFAVGETVVLFLEPATDEPNAFVVLGLAAGKVSLENLKGEPRAIRRTEGLGFAAPGGKAIKRVEPVEDLGPADAFINRIRKAVAAGATR